MDTGVGIEERRTALAPYLELLGRLEQQPEQPAEVDFPPALALGNWEQNAVRAALAAGPEAQRSWESLLAEGVALQTKYFAEVERLQAEAPPLPEADEKLRQQVLHTLAIGLALMQEIQREIDTMVLAGNVPQAKKLTVFRNKLGQLIAQMKERVGDDGCVLAQALALDMVTPVERVKPKPAAERAEEQPLQPMKLETRHRPMGQILTKQETQNRLKPLLIVLAVVVAAWMVLILPRAFVPSIPELTDQELAFSPAIREVIARPPSLFLVMDGAAWRQMSPEQRDALVRQVGETAGAAGYSGAHLRLPDGTTVAQWSRARGVTLVSPSRTGS